MKRKNQNRAALLVVDIQNGFIEESELPVPGGREVIPVINRLMPLFDVVVASQDWHPPGHGSFHTRHPGASPYDLGTLGGKEQILWPVHCVQGTRGAQFAPGIKTEFFQAVIRKGMDPEVDSYSVFYDNHHLNPSGLQGYLKERGVGRIFLAGLALDFCVRYSARDALEFTSEIFVIEDACRGVAAESVVGTKREFAEKGIRLIQSPEVENFLKA
jgi:nicotinamidase/pyrazinamidase